MTAPRARLGLRDVLAFSGEVGGDLAAVDWAATPLGPVETWPRSLQTIVGVLLTSRFSMWMAWGPELTFLCNDKYRRDTLASKYPWALGRSAREVWAEIWPEIGPRIETVISSGEATWDENLLLFLERSGYPEETYHTFSYSPLADDAGLVAGMLCVVTETTEQVIGARRMATLRELGAVASSARDEDEFLQATCRELAANPASLPFTITYLFDDDPDGARLACSSGIEEGHPAAPATVRADASDLSDLSDASDPSDAFDRSGGSGGPWPVSELRAGRAVVVDVTGERHGELPAGVWDKPPLRALAVPVVNVAHGQPYGFLVVGLNRYRPLDDGYRSFVELIAQHLAGGISTARSYEYERRRAAQLEELDEAKTAFFSNVSHEFRTPLTLMLGPLQDAIGEACGLDADQLELVHRNARRLLKLVNALLDFSRAEAGRMRAEFRPTDIGALTAQLAGTFSDAAQRAGIELVIDCEEPPEPVYLDRDLWERIVMNLLSNAFKATLEGRITVTLHAVPDGVELAVSDTGSGIPAEEMSRLFQRFHRVRRAARSYEGTGIGLALVKELAELHGGEVSARSALGEGSRFRVRLPLGRSHLPPDQVSERDVAPSDSISPLFVEEAESWIARSGGREVPDQISADPAAPGEPGDRRGRVLIADDNPDLRRYLMLLLADHVDVESVGDGEAALAVTRVRPPDLVITDVMMPRLDGYELLAALRADPRTRELPVIMLSARAGEEAAIDGLAAGADDYLPKPFSGRELLARVRTHLELSRVRREAAAELRTERLRLEQTLQQLPVGAMIAEAPSGRIVFANDQASAILGPSMLRGALSDLPIFRLGAEGPAVERWPLTRALRGHEIVRDEDLLYEAGAGSRVTVRVSAAPIRDEDGEVFAAVVVFQDVSERVRSQRLLSAQRDILALIADGEPLPRTLEAIVRCVESISEYDARASILLLSADGRRLTHGAAPSLPAAYLRAIDGLEVGPNAGSCGTAAFRDAPVIVADTSTDPLWRDYRELAAEHALGACWSTPIHADDGRLVGTVAVYYDQPRRPAEEDRRIVDLLTRTAGVAIGRAHDAAQRARQLSELQTSLLPRDLPRVPGIGVAVSFRPGDPALEVGGDFYDLFALPDGAWGVVIGDVCGHGAEAAAVTALTRHTTRAIARLQPRPARVLEVVNDALRHSGYGRFCTAVYGRLEPGESGVRIRMARGGHPAPLVRRADGEVRALGGHGPLLGVFAEPRFPEVEVELGVGDLLLFYTDGLVERNPRLSGDAGLRSLLSALPADSAADLLAELEARALPVPGRLRDDTAILALQATGPVRPRDDAVQDRPGARQEPVLTEQ